MMKLFRTETEARKLVQVISESSGGRNVCRVMEAKTSRHGSLLGYMVLSTTTGTVLGERGLETVDSVWTHRPDVGEIIACE